MKTNLLILALAILFPGLLSAQVSQGDIQLVQKYFGMEKLALVKDYMELSPKQDSAFWPVYNRYETERQELGKKRIELVDMYMNSLGSINEAKATELVDRGITIETSFKKLQKKYFTEMTKVIGPVKAAQFYQLENYLNNIINITIQESIPFVGELELKRESVRQQK